jgi:hypothetical protein
LSQDSPALAELKLQKLEQQLSLHDLNQESANSDLRLSTDPESLDYHIDNSFDRAPREKRKLFTILKVDK